MSDSLIFPLAQLTTPPLQVTSFLGREQELQHLKGLLPRPDVRLLTVTGPGGIGKSRLALRMMECVQEIYADGAVFVPLAPVLDPALVVPTIAQALKVTEAPEQPVTARLHAFFADRRLLLVLDNAEHVLEAVAALVSNLLAGCPQLTILVTSRVRLGLSGEQVVPLGTMDPDTARALFTARAQAVQPAFAATPETAPIIDAICDRLDRLPLAIELAAARVAVLPLLALQRRLEHRLDLLTGGPRDAPDRQRDMRVTIAWSHDLLPESEQLLYRRLGIFVGGFALDAAQALAGDDHDVLAGVSALVTASLIIPVEGAGDEPRFTMLETIREDALERLIASGEEPVIRERHARHLVELAEHLWDANVWPIIEPWLDRLRPEIDNLRLALAWTLEHDPSAAQQLTGALMQYWMTYVPLAEAWRWVMRALEVTSDAPSHEYARLVLTAGMIAHDQGAWEDAEAFLVESLARARFLADGRLQILSVSILGLVALDRNDLDQARALFREAWTLSEQHGVPQFVASAAANFGRVAMAEGDLGEAEAFFEDALVRHQAASGPIGVAFGHRYLGQVLLARGKHARAMEHFQAAFATFMETGCLGLMAPTMEGLAGAAVTVQPEHAARLLGAAMTIREREGMLRDQDEALIYACTLETARIVLGEHVFEAMWDLGKRYTREDVLAEVHALVTPIANVLDPLPTPDNSGGLSPREGEVLRLVAEGASNRMIADALSISERTVENHVHHILDKLGLDSRVMAATWAVRHDLA